jgi:hypothetical protein
LCPAAAAVLTRPDVVRSTTTKPILRRERNRIKLRMNSVGLIVVIIILAANEDKKLSGVSEEVKNENFNICGIPCTGPAAVP